MKIKLFSILFCISAFAGAAAAQSFSVVKLFNAEPISLSDPNIMANQMPYGSYRSVQVYLSCPTSVQPQSFVSGPNGGGLAVDNYLTINDRNVCNGHADSCFADTITSPLNVVGFPMESAYIPVPAIDASNVITMTGLYTFNLIDVDNTTGGNTEIYLNTSCSIIPINTPVPERQVTICHRNNGNRAGSQTITVGSNAVTAHLDHGDQTGPCGQ